MSTISASTTSTTAYKVTADTTGTLVFQTGSTPTTAVTINTSQNVGIGTTSPSVRLHAKTGSSNAISDSRYIVTAEGSSEAYLCASAADYAGIRFPNASSASQAYIDYTHGTNHMSFGVNNGERMRIDSSGNLLVAGTTANSWTSNGSVTIGAGSGAMGYNANIGTGTGGLYFMTATSGGGRHAGTVGYDGTSNYMWFETNSTERARIDSSGRLLVGATSTVVNESSLGVSSAGNTATFKTTGGTGNSAILVWNSGTSGTRGLIQFSAGSSYSAIGSIESNGTSTSYNTSSDYRLKENIQPMTDALSVVSQLKPVTYTWKTDGSNGQGFIAHELQAVVPDCVTGEKDAVDADGNPKYQGIDTSFLVATLTAAIQELKAELDSAKADIATLKGAA